MNDDTSLGVAEVLAGVGLGLLLVERVGQGRVEFLPAVAAGAVLNGVVTRGLFRWSR